MSCQYESKRVVCPVPEKFSNNPHRAHGLPAVGAKACAGIRPARGEGITRIFLFLDDAEFLKIHEAPNDSLISRLTSKALSPTILPGIQSMCGRSTGCPLNTRRLFSRVGIGGNPHFFQNVDCMPTSPYFIRRCG